MDKKKILIVEDDKMLCRIFEMFLTKNNYEVVGYVPDGKQALALCEKHHPDVIIMDVHLDEELTGIDTAKLIHKKYNIPVVFLSGDKTDKTIQEAICENSYGYLRKPTDNETLKIAVEFAYYKHKFRQEKSTLV